MVPPLAHGPFPRSMALFQNRVESSIATCGEYGKVPVKCTDSERRLALAAALSFSDEICASRNCCSVFRLRFSKVSLRLSAVSWSTRSFNWCRCACSSASQLRAASNLALSICSLASNSLAWSIEIEDIKSS